MTDATRDRFELHQAVAAELGDRHAATLMSLLNDRPNTDLATREDVRVLLAAQSAELRNEMADLKRWTVSVILAGNTALVAAVAGVMAALG